MNNWLGFSLSPQEIPSQQPHHHHHHNHLSFNSDEINGSTADECFDLSAAASHSTLLPSLNLTPTAPTFGLVQPFNNNHSQDWSMKEDVNMNSSSRVVLMGSSCSNQGQGPKLENFLGVSSSANYHNNNSNSNGGDYMYTSVVEEPLSAEAATTTGSSGGGFGSNNTIGISMIKNWLRNNPAPPPPPSMAADVDRSSGGGGGMGTANDHVTTNNNNNNKNNSSQTLSLSMSTGGSQSSCSPFPAASSGGGGETCSSSDNKRQMMTMMMMIEGTNAGGLECQTTNGAAAAAAAAGGGAIEAVVPPPRKSIDTFGQRTSIYRGVTRHRWTGRYEAHLWDNSCRREGQTRKGRQVYLGGYDKEEKAARAYDLAALKYWGTTTTTNFPMSNYEKEIEEMKPMTRQEYVASLRRKSSGFSRGASIYRGVTRHHQHGRWQARIGRVAGNKDLYLGTFSTQEEAAEAYDIAAIKFRGLNAVTNFEISRYDVKSILESSTLPIGGAAKRLKDAEQAAANAAAAADITTLDYCSSSTTHRYNNMQENNNNSTTSQLTDHSINNYYHNWMPTVAYQPNPNFSIHYPYGQQQRMIWCKQEQQELVTAAATATATDGNDDVNGTTTHQSNFQDHQYHHHHHHQSSSSSSTHDFFQPSSVLHNLMNLDSSSLDNNAAAAAAAAAAANYNNQGGAYGLPVATMVDQPMKFGGGGYNGENELVLTTKHQQQFSGGYESNGYDHHHHHINYNNWPLPTAIPTLAHHEAATFTVWNDT